MKHLQHKLVQRGLWILGATAGGTCLAYLFNLAAGGGSTVATLAYTAVPAALTGAAIASGFSEGRGGPWGG